MPRKTLLIGCGYVGLPLALRFQEQGDAVTTWVHSPASAEALTGHCFHRVIVGSVADEKNWKSLDEKYERVIHCASSGRGGEEAYREVFLEGAQMMGRYQTEARKILVSSTSVYGQADGEWVTEESRAEPSTATSKILREAEKEALSSATIVVRSSGIYGPGRSMLFEKFRRGEAMIEGDGMRWINQIHQQDLVAALMHLVEKGRQGEIYNASDDMPIMQRDFYAWCSEFLGKPMPLHGPVNTERKRGLTNKRVSNAKLRATGWSPIYPGFREGLTTNT